MNREEEIFEAAAALPLAERAACLDAACASQPALRARIEALLRSHEVTGFMEDHTTVSRSVPAEQPGERIGRYRLLQQIGEGGFGTVWMAEQIEPVTRRVALGAVFGIAFSPDNQRLALMSGGARGIVLWDVTTLRELISEFRRQNYDAAGPALAAAESAAADLEELKRLYVAAGFFRAMNLYRQSREQEARELFAAVAAKMKPLPTGDDPLLVGDYDDDLLCWLACKEARELLDMK